MNEIKELVNESMNGNLKSFEKLIEKLIEKSYKEVIAIDFGEQALKKVDLILVLNQLKEKKFDNELIQQWGSFMRRGYIQIKKKVTIDIDIEFEDEEMMIEIIARLDELGDIIDGEMSISEIENFINLLKNE